MNLKNRNNFLLYFLWTGLLFLPTADSAQGKLTEDSGDGFSATFSSNQTVVSLCLVSLGFIVTAIVVVLTCNDCYNTEVSSESHAACNSDTNRKWGGAVGYSSDNTRTSAVSFGETVTVDSTSSPLPYSMIPTAIPDQAGFQGYSSSSRGDSVQQGLVGYQSSTGNPSAPPGDGPRNYNPISAPTGDGPRNYNPMEDQVAPPSYSDALLHSRSGSIR